MLSKSDSINPLFEVGYNDCVVCCHCNKNNLIRTIGDHWRYCKYYIIQCLGEDETKKE